MNLSPGYLWASIVCTVAVLFLILLSVIDKRTPPPTQPFVPYEADDDCDADVLEMFMLAAIARGDKALADYVEDRDGQHLINGLLDMRNRLAQGLDMEPDELAARLDDERQRT